MENNFSSNKQSNVPNIDVHEFDGSLSINLPNFFSKEEKLVKMKNLIKSIQDSNALSMLKIIVFDLINESDEKDKIRNKNYDEYNKIDATDILANILSKDIGKEIYKLLEEQLSDMYLLGQCSQGRTTRLIQIWNILD